MPVRPYPDSWGHWLPSNVRWLAALMVAATWAWGDDRPTALEGIDDIERRIRLQKDQNLQAVRTLIQRLGEQSRVHRAELQKTEKERARAGVELRVLGEVPEPLEPSTVDDAPNDAIPRPSPGSLAHSPRADSSARRVEPGLPAMRDNDRMIPKQDLPTL